MNNILLFELFNNDYISTYIDWSIVIATFIYLCYLINIKGLLYRTYLLHVWVGSCYAIKNGIYNIETLSNYILNRSDYNINDLLAQQKYLSYNIDSLSYNNLYNKIIVRTSEVEKYNRFDLYIYKNIDITKLIPNNISPHRWENIIVEIDYIINKTHITLLYNELPIIMDNIINQLNIVINPWNNIINYINNIINLGDNVNLFNDLLVPIINIPVTYTININENYIEYTKYINISLLSFSIVISYLLYILINICKNNKSNK